MDQHLAQVHVAALADAEQPGLATGRVLPRHDAQPCREVASFAERSAVADRGNDGCGNHRPNTWDLPNARTAGVGSRDAIQLLAELNDLSLDALPFVLKRVDQVAHHGCQVGFRVLQHVCHRGPELGRPLREYQAAFQQKRTDLVDHHRAA